MALSRPKETLGTPGRVTQADELQVTVISYRESRRAALSTGLRQCAWGIALRPSMTTLLWAAGTMRWPKCYGSCPSLSPSPYV